MSGRARGRTQAQRYQGQEGRALFRAEQLFLEDGRPLGEALEPWQIDNILRPLDERDAQGRPRYRLLDIELPRGHGKTTLAAAEATTELALGGAHRRIYAFATDEDQARLLHEAVAGFVRRNPALSAAFRIDRRTVRLPRTDSYLQVMAADAASAHGLTPDLVIFDELGQLQGRRLWDAAYTAVAKKPWARLIAISTPGWSRSSIAWEVREAARTIDGYHLWAPGQRLASWLDEAELERQRQLLPAHVFRRLHLGQWSEGEGAFITTQDLSRCRKPERTPRLECQEGWHIIAVDLGLKSDRTAVAVVHRTPTGVALDQLRIWQGTRSAPVSITEEVEPFIASCLASFGDVYAVVLDPWQSQSTYERLKDRVRVKPFTFSGGNIDQLTRNLYSLAHNGQLELYPDPELERELLDVQVVERDYGLRLDHRAGGHDDRVIALGMAAHVAMQLPAERHLYWAFLDFAPPSEDRLWRAIG